MTERVFARQIQGDLWQWRLLTNHGEWASDAWDTGDDDALKETMPTSAPVLVMLNGQAIISSNAEMEEKDKRHIAKLLPLSVEQGQLIIDDLAASPAETVEDITSLSSIDAIFPPRGEDGSSFSTADLAVSSSYFLYFGEVGVGDHVKRGKSLLHRVSEDQIQTLRRTDANF